MSCTRHTVIRCLCILLFMGSALVSHAQPKKEYPTKNKRAIEAFEKALNLYRYQYYEDAMIRLEAAMKLDPNFPDPYILRGQLYEEVDMLDSAVVDYRKALSLAPDYDLRLYYLLANAEAELFEWPEAKEHLNALLAKPELEDWLKKKAEALQETLKHREAMVQNPVPFNPMNLGSNVNEEWYEHSPTLRADGERLYFTRNEPTNHEPIPGTRGMDEDLYVAQRAADGSWTGTRNLGRGINTKYREGATCISPDGNYLFFTSCGRPDSKGTCDLYLARRKGEVWANPRNLGAVINSRHWESQPNFAIDGRTLYFVSNRPGGKGGRDIWMTRIGDDSRWTEPVSLSINTPMDDESPFLHPDGHTFYFASEGYPGMGQRDLFVVELKEDGTFGEPRNLGYPINTPGDEVSLSVASDGKTAYYASERAEGHGYWDLYSFELPESVQAEKVAYSKGKVYDSETRKPLQARFELIDLESGKRLVESYSDQVTGEFLVSVPPHRDYALNVSASGYLFFSEHFSLRETEGEDSYAFDVPLDPIRVGKKVILKNIFFETDKYDLKAESRVELDKLIFFLEQNENVRIEIGGHTDNVGSESYNQQLSENRAKAVYVYLQEHGVDPARLSYKGYNFQEPVASNETEEGRAQNRRTEFKIVE